jgi:Holliday junction resolvase
MPGKREYAVGRAYEFVLMKILRERGFYVVRTPASGRGTSSQKLPDLTAIRRRDGGSEVLLIEVKHFSRPRDVYLEKQRFQQLMKLAEELGARALLCVHFSPSTSIKCLDLKDYDWETPGYYVFDKRSFEERGVDAASL